MKYQTTAELVKAITRLKDDLILTGNDSASSKLVEGLSYLNGMTDGWAQLLEGLNTINDCCSNELSDDQISKLNDIQNEVNKIVYRA